MMPAPQFGMCITKNYVPLIEKVMKISIKDPETDIILNCEAFAAENEQEQGWSVLLPKGSSIFITEQQGEWKVRHDGTVNLKLVDELGIAITNHLATKEMAWEASSNPEKQEDRREQEQLIRAKREE